MSRREAEAEDLVEKRGKVEVYRTLKLSEAGKPDIVVAAGTAIKLHSGEGDPYVGVLREVLVVRRAERAAGEQLQAGSNASQETTKSGGKSYRLPLYWLYRPYEARRGRERKARHNPRGGARAQPRGGRRLRRRSAPSHASARQGGENEMWAPKQARRESLLSSSPEQTTLHKLLRGGT